MKTLEGHMLQFNYSPKGCYEGLLLETKQGIVQLNFAAEFARSMVAAVTNHMRLTIKAEVWDDERKSDHPVFELKELKANGKRVKLESVTAVEGSVLRLNYAKHGEINGAVLDNGDFVHLRPLGAAAVGLKIGQKLQVKGESLPGLFGEGNVIEAHTANGLNLDKHKALNKAAKQAAKKTAKKAAQAPHAKNRRTSAKIS
jgi:hypothetical protein